MAQTLPYEKVKLIRLKYKDLVFGFIRQCQEMFGFNETFYQIHKSIQYSILLFYYSFIESKILKDAEIDKLLSMFEEENKFKELDLYSYNLLYASYRDGIGEQIFKKICHDQVHLLCLIETEEGNVWGGYTSKGWRGMHYATEQDDDNAFVFVIRSKDNYPPKIFNVLKEKACDALFNQDRFYCEFGTDGIYYIGLDGKSGGSFHSHERIEEYGCLPYKNYVCGTHPFHVKNIETFQLK